MIFSFFWRGAPSDLPSCPQAALHFTGLACADRPQLGEGAAAKAYVVQRKSEGNSIEEFVLRIQKIDTRDRKAAVETERDVMLKARHPNIVELVDWKFDAPFAYLVLEYGQEGTLRSYMEKRGREFDNPVAAIKVFRMIAEAADYMHKEMGLVHGDIKDTNVVVMRDETIRLIDFDMAVKYGSFETGHGTAGWMDPQFYRAEEESDLFVYNDKVDVYSMGVVLYQMFHGGELPFGRGYEYRRRIKDGSYVVRAGVPFEVVYIINACLQAEPSNRPSIEAILRWTDTLADGHHIKLTKKQLAESNWRRSSEEVNRVTEDALARSDLVAISTKKII